MKKIYKILAAALLSGVSAIGASAAVYHGLTVSLNDGTTVSVELSDEFSATFTGSHLHLVSATREVDVPREKLVSFAFTGEDGIDAVDADGDAPVVGGGKISFTGLADGTVVAVHDLAGRLLSQEVVSGSHTVDLGSLAPGVVIVSVNGVSYKVNVK